MEKYLNQHKIKTLIHAAAFTSPPKVEQDPERGILTNIIGTANIVRLCSTHKIKLIYISTDYVFQGDRGNYTEDDPVYPVNKYAWSKLGGECAAKMYTDSIIVRTTFGPNVFPYEKAFADQWTSRENVSTIAKKIIGLVDMNYRGVIHVGGDRRTVLQYAKSLDPRRDIKAISIKDMPFKVPADTSLNCERFKTLAGDNK
jgi:dTDP-4-dehydrorhamnose reductase